MTVKIPILFDIDRTLIDTDRIKIKRIKTIAKKLNMEIEEIEAARQKYLATLDYKPDYNPDDFISKVSRDLGVTEEKLAEAYYNPEVIRSEVFSDAEETLKTLEAEKCRLGIYSEGWEHYQMKKLNFAGLINYFDNDLIFISRRKKDPEFIARLPRPAIVVDDAIGFIEEIAKYEGLTPIWLNRKTKAADSKVKTIFNLSELLPIVSNN